MESTMRSIVVQKGKEKENVKEAKRLLAHNDGVEIREACNCGAIIKHNTAGNYHRIYKFSWLPSQAKIEIKRGSTSEFADWETLTIAGAGVAFYILDGVVLGMYN